jgi:hypothetical protein
MGLTDEWRRDLDAMVTEDWTALFAKADVCARSCVHSVCCCTGSTTHHWTTTDTEGVENTIHAENERRKEERKQQRGDIGGVGEGGGRMKAECNKQT